MKEKTEIKILFVDDDHDFREAIMELIFSTFGVTPKAAIDGAHAEEIIRDWCPDVIITDTNMPIKNGVDLIRTVKAKYPQVVIFSLFSGLDGSPITAHDIKNLGVYLVLQKNEIRSRLLPALEVLFKK